jgi:hypothetical protein
MAPPPVDRAGSALAAHLLARAPLRFAGGADAAADRPAHVRAGSGLAWVGGRLAAIMDDANFVALIDPLAPHAAAAVALPPGESGHRQFGDSRGTKHLKLDLEACVATPDVDPLLVAFGSGSLPAREQVVIVEGLAAGTPRATLLHRPALYRTLREARGFAGSELNIEGAVLLDLPEGRTLRLFGRGNGAARGAVVPLNAACDLDWDELMRHLRDPDNPPPSPRRITDYALGLLGGVPLGFTDAAQCGGTVLFTAAAEASPDAVRDGEVSGSAIGIIGADDGVRWAAIVDEHGAVLREKAEGLAVADADAGELWVLLDADDEDRASELCRVRLEGWRQ